MPRTISRPTVRPMVEDSAPMWEPPATCATVFAARPPRVGGAAGICASGAASGTGGLGLGHPRRQHLARALAVHRLRVLGQLLRLGGCRLQLLAAVSGAHARGGRDQPRGERRRRRAARRRAR